MKGDIHAANCVRAHAHTCHVKTWRFCSPYAVSWKTTL